MFSQASVCPHGACMAKGDMSGEGGMSGKGDVCGEGEGMHGEGGCAC